MTIILSMLSGSAVMIASQDVSGAQRGRAFTSPRTASYPVRKIAQTSNKKISIKTFHQLKNIRRVEKPETQVFF